MKKQKGQLNIVNAACPRKGTERKNLIYVMVALLLLPTLLCCFTGCKSKVDTIDDNYRVFYELFVGSFSDSNGDGVGDIRGIINRMDYLNDGDTTNGKSLGVQGIWLSPIFASPSYHKYDVTDYYKIDSKFGTEDDLKELIELCHKRNVKLILDLPINHTSDGNLWFANFANAHRQNNVDSQFYDYYSYCTLQTRLGGHGYAPITGCNNEYYECNFGTDMPELNFDNTAVRQEVLSVAKYYLNLGVDGFRFDAVKYVYYTDTAKSVDFWKWFKQELDKINPEIYCIGECWSAESETIEYISALNCFNFQMAQAEGIIAMAAKGSNISTFTNYVENYLTKIKSANSNSMIIPFISNHDMDRSSGYLTLGTKRAYMAANLYILCSGSPVIYYGEEIGLKGVRGTANTDANRRLAMLWGDGDTVTDPEGATYPASKQTNGTVTWHIEQDYSLYNHYVNLIAFRNKYPEIARGSYKALVYDDTRFGGFQITYEDSTIGLFHNTSDAERVIDLSSCSNASVNFSALQGYIGQGQASLNGNILTIGPQTSVVLK